MYGYWLHDILRLYHHWLRVICSLRQWLHFLRLSNIDWLIFYGPLAAAVDANNDQNDDENNATNNSTNYSPSHIGFLTYEFRTTVKHKVVVRCLSRTAIPRRCVIEANGFNTEVKLRVVLCFCVNTILRGAVL